MKKLILVFTLFLSQMTFVTTVKAKDKAPALGYQKSDWDIYEDRYGKYLGLKKVQMKMVKIYTLSGEISILKVEHPKEAPHLSLIHYYAGAAGTSQIVRSYRAVVYNTMTQKFLGQAGIKYESNGEVQEAQWTYQKDKILVNDPQEGKKTILIE